MTPLSYFLHVFPDFETELFSGTVTIKLLVLYDREFIVLHAKDLVIENVIIWKYVHVNESYVVPTAFALKNVSAIDKYDMLLLETESTIHAGSYTLTIHFHGRLSKNNEGLFMMSYTDPDTYYIRYIILFFNRNFYYTDSKIKFKLANC